MEKRIIAILLVALLFAVPCLAENGGSDCFVELKIGDPVINVNGLETRIDDNGTVPVILNNRTLLPVRAVIENLGGTVDWDDDTKTASLTLNGSLIKLVINSEKAYLNGEEKTLDCAPVILNGRTMLPIRFIAESFGFDVNWNEEEKTVKITYGQKEEKDAAKLLYMGQGSVRIVTAEGKVIYIDPYAGDGYGLPADLILITHAHPDHNALDKIEERNEDCVLITWKEALKDGLHQTFDLGYVHVEAVEAGYNKNHDVNECVGYVLTLSDGKKIYLSGDTSTTKQMSEMSKMEIDYAFYCCDGTFNMDMEEAAKCAETVGAKHNIPYHMGGKGPGRYDRETAEKFAAPNRLIIDAGEEITIE